MRIACPACNAVYQVPDDRLSEGRMVRCARCSTDWAPLEAVSASDDFAKPDVAEPGIAEPQIAVPEPQDGLVPQAREFDATRPDSAVVPRKMAFDEDIPLPRPSKQSQRAAGRPVLLVLAWVVSLAVVGGALAGLYVGRERVMATWPPSIRAYAALGLSERPAVTSEGRE